MRYRLLQSAFHMEDYSSKGSRVISLRKLHRNQQARITDDAIQPGTVYTHMHTHVTSLVSDLKAQGPVYYIICIQVNECTCSEHT